jgi:hypothetical protein
MKPFVITVCILLTASLAGQTASTKKPILGAGVTPCSQWAATVQGPGALSIGRHDPVQASWILGYVSADGVTGRAAEPNGESYVEGLVTGLCTAQPTQSLIERSALGN